jgi:hypothetical protein
MFAKPGFWPRVSTYEGREIERALAGPNLLDAGIDLGWSRQRLTKCCLLRIAGRVDTRNVLEVLQLERLARTLHWWQARKEVFC